MAALTSRGNVYFWGYDMSGQFAHPDTYGSAVHVPIRSPSMHCIVEVSMADNYACVRDAWGEVACHGGTPPGIDQGIVPAFGEARALSMGYLAGVATDGQALFAGIWNYDGDNNLVVQSPPGWPHGPEPRFATLPTSGGPACGIDPHAAAWCFGFNDYGQIGDGTLEDAAQPQPVLGLGPVKQLAVERDRRCARTIDNRLACWGRGPLGDGSTPNDYSSTAVFLDTLVDVQDVAMSLAATCAVTGDGDVKCWGKFPGTGMPTPTNVPNTIKIEGGAVAVRALDGASCALRADGVVLCWGDGILAGDGTAFAVHYTPQQILFPGL